MTKRSRRRSRTRKRKTKKRRGGRLKVSHAETASGVLESFFPKKVSKPLKKQRTTRKKSYIKKVAKRIRVPGETWESALNRAKNLQIDAPPFDPEKWNSDQWLRNPHNCYTYALDKIDPKLTAECKRIKCEMKNHLKPQPGYYAGEQRIDDKSKYSCDLVMDRVFKDNPKFIKKDNMVCPKNYYSAALAVHPGLTYHFYKQDPDGFWSHKDGATDAKRYDADGNFILDPQKANRHYKGKKIDGHVVNYKDFCGYFCVPKDQNLKNWQSGPNKPDRPQGIVRTRSSMKGGSKSHKQYVSDEQIQSLDAIPWDIKNEKKKKRKKRTRKKLSKN